jgi:hypothetical protein
MTRQTRLLGALFACALAVMSWWWGTMSVSAQFPEGAFMNPNPVKSKPLRRFYLDWPREAQVHYYSTESVGTNASDWIFERIEGYVSPERRDYTDGLAQYYFEPWFDHVYTTRQEESASLSESGYRFERVVGHVLSADRDLPGTVPLYRFTRSHVANGHHYQDHFYSLSPTVPAEYIAEGVCCRVWTRQVDLPKALVAIADPLPKERWPNASAQNVGWMVWTGGGNMRLSYSTNNGQSWSAVADVALPATEGLVTNGRYTWKLPTSVGGAVRVRLDWASRPGAAPWASAETDVVVERAKVPAIRIRKH